MRRTGWLLVLLALLAPAQAQDGATQATPSMRESCPGMVAQAPRATPVSLRRASLERDQIKIDFVGHSTFVIESPGGVRIATDYNDYIKPRVLPQVITMNRAHSTHYTLYPEPEIKHVLRGWGESADRPARHDVQIGDVRVRNVPTNIRDWSGGTERHGNSIFVFEIAGLCIAHLGHLHHTLTQAQLDEIGRVDVVFVPVDGSYTLDLDGMVEVLRAMQAPLMIPMHYFSRYSLQRFLDKLATNEVEVAFNELPSVTLSKATLPVRSKMLVLPGR